jgi:hypothetical protein
MIFFPIESHLYVPMHPTYLEWKEDYAFARVYKDTNGTG